MLAMVNKILVAMDRSGQSRTVFNQVKLEVRWAIAEKLIGLEAGELVGL